MWLDHALPDKQIVSCVSGLKHAMQNDEEATVHKPTISTALSTYVDESRLSIWGLGRGIKATVPTQLQSIVARPIPIDAPNEDGVEPRVEEMQVATGYSSVSRDVLDELMLTDKLRASLHLEDASPIVFHALEFYGSFKNTKDNSLTDVKTIVIKQIRNRTYEFRLNSHDTKGHDPTRQSEKTLTSVEQCLLKRVEQSTGRSPLAALPDCVLPDSHERSNETKEEKKKRIRKRWKNYARR